jgi:hypothetical protein
MIFKIKNISLFNRKIIFNFFKNLTQKKEKKNKDKNSVYFFNLNK